MNGWRNLNPVNVVTQSYIGFQQEEQKNIFQDAKNAKEKSQATIKMVEG